MKNLVSAKRDGTRLEYPKRNIYRVELAEDARQI